MRMEWTALAPAVAVVGWPGIRLTARCSLHDRLGLLVSGFSLLWVVEARWLAVVKSDGGGGSV